MVKIRSPVVPGTGATVDDLLTMMNEEEKKFHDSEIDQMEARARELIDKAHHQMQIEGIPFSVAVGSMLAASVLMLRHLDGADEEKIELLDRMKKEALEPVDQSMRLR